MLAGVAAVLAAVSIACCVAVVPLHTWVAARADIPALTFGDLLLGSVWPAVGALVVRARPRNPVGWLMMLAALIGPYQLLAHYAAASALVSAEPLPGATAAAWVGVWGFVPYFFAVPLVALVFPDGELLSRRWRPVFGGLVAVGVATTIARMLSPIGMDVAPQVPNPLGVPGAGWLGYVTVAGAVTALLLGSLIGVLSVALRLRRAVGVQRAQLQWLLLGTVVLAVGLLAPVPAGAPREAAFALGLLGPPLGIGVAMLRHRLFDVEFALNRTIVYTVLSLLVVGGYAAAVYGVQLVAPGSTVGVVVVAIAALLAAAGRDAVQGMVDRLLFGYRHDPYAVVSRVGRHVAPAAEPVEALQRLVDALRGALRLPYVAYRGEVVVEAGEPVAGWRVVPARALGQQVGELHVGRRDAGERWTTEEQAAVEEVAARAGTLAYAAGLVADVQRSRERIVVAREEERRRLRADLHDGVGPALAGTAHQLDALARRIEAGGQADLAVRARDLRDRLRRTVGDVRSVVHGLRPPVLDQLGLPGALRELTAGYETPECSAVVDDLGELPAAVEVAGYAIAAEAVANAVRHSAAARLTVRARVDQEVLVLEVSDDGCGVPSRPSAGVGLRSMGERAAEVGGRLDVLPAPGGGTVVRAELPVGSR